MGVETRTFPDREADLDHVARELADYLQRERGFTAKLRTRTANGVLLQMEKSDFGRQLTGLVYTLQVELERKDGTVSVRVDDGDLRNQILALGIGAIVAWPLLLTAGYGWISKGDVREEVVRKAATLLAATF
ncbi:MAG TPA: hypothetical protein VHG91_08535 [Longimicrobium sp.]|nr:hypothetical protein [Longimicrobium sp.]